MRHQNRLAIALVASGLPQLPVVCLEDANWPVNILKLLTKW